MDKNTLYIMYFQVAAEGGENVFAVLSHAGAMLTSQAGRSAHMMTSSHADITSHFLSAASADVRRLPLLRSLSVRVTSAHLRFPETSESATLCLVDAGVYHILRCDIYIFNSATH